MLYGGRKESLFGRLGPKVVLAGSMAAAALTVLLFLGIRSLFGGRPLAGGEAKDGIAAIAGSSGAADAGAATAGAAGAVEAPGRNAGLSGAGTAATAPAAGHGAGEVRLPPAARKVLPGEQLIGAGKASEALRWADSFSGAAEDKPRVALVRARALAALGRTDEARKALDDVAAGSGPESVEARLDILRMEGKADAGTLRGLWAGVPKGRAGAKVATALADALWESSRRKPSVNECKGDLEECRRAYSEALLYGDLDRAEEDRILTRMEVLNKALIFNANAETDAPRSVIHVVRSGESPSSIAAKYGVAVGQVSRLNGLSGKSVLQVGQRLKLLPGKWRLVVRRSSLTMLAMWEGTFVKKYPVGIGPGDATPLGEFTITKKMVNPDWYFEGRRIPYGDPKNILGTRWMGFDPNGPGRGLGIHGTTEPDSVPGRKSRGCIRMLNGDVEELYDLVPTGTVVEIVE
ncbi:MAG: L,D-transpeptidase family protein [Planctomycetota bacterium]|nr:L,D-transpeptidase family protein [Planctomycetota bacterium]